MVFVGYYCCHSLRGLCGLKYIINYYRFIRNFSHSLRGLCGLKFGNGCQVPGNPGHSLRGLCGLKSMGILVYVSMCMSQPARAVWIEIPMSVSIFWAYLVTACEGCVDWNIRTADGWANQVRHSLRGLCGLKFRWDVVPSYPTWVTACEGCVDWN